MYTEITRISGFRRDVHGIYALLGYYAAQSGNSLPTFRANLSVTYSRAKKSKRKNNVGCPNRRQEITTLRCVTSQKRADLELEGLYSNFTLVLLTTYGILSVLQT